MLWSHKLINFQLNFRLQKTKITRCKVWDVRLNRNVLSAKNLINKNLFRNVLRLLCDRHKKSFFFFCFPSSTHWHIQCKWNCKKFSHKSEFFTCIMHHMHTYVAAVIFRFHFRISHWLDNTHAGPFKELFMNNFSA